MHKQTRAQDGRGEREEKKREEKRKGTRMTQTRGLEKEERTVQRRHAGETERMPNPGVSFVLLRLMVLFLACLPVCILSPPFLRVRFYSWRSEAHASKD